MKKQHLTLTDADRASLEAVLNQKIQRSRVFKRATALLELDRGRTLEAVSQTVGVSYQSVSAWRDKYRSGGLEAVLREAPRPGRPIVIDGEQRAKITALACSRPPQGHARWSLRLLADKVVELDVCESISATHVRTILKKTTSVRTSRKRGASAK
jgi:putative transposase